MSKLRNQVIRLAHENPALRSNLLPLLKEASPMDSNEFMDRYLIESRTGILYDQKMLLKSFMRKYGRMYRGDIPQFRSRVKWLLNSEAYMRGFKGVSPAYWVSETMHRILGDWYDEQAGREPEQLPGAPRSWPDKW